MSQRTVFKPGVRVRTRHAIGAMGLHEGAEGHVQRIDRRGYVDIVWDGEWVEPPRPIHYEHLEVVGKKAP